MKLLNTGNPSQQPGLSRTCRCCVIRVPVAVLDVESGAPIWAL